MDRIIFFNLPHFSITVAFHIYFARRERPVFHILFLERNQHFVLFTGVFIYGNLPFIFKLYLEMPLNTIQDI